MRAKSMKKTPKIHAMQPEEMKQILESMRFGLVDLAAVTKIPYRTLQDYLAGKRSIPQHVAKQLRNEAAKEKRIKEWLYKKMERDIAKEFPNGISSETSKEDEIEY